MMGLRISERRLCSMVSIIILYRSVMCCALALIGQALIYTDAFLPQPILYRRSINKYATPCNMVRNIDLPECLIFYGVTSMMGDGLDRLLRECKEMETAVILIDNETDTDDSSVENQLEKMGVVRYRATEPPPNPRDLYESVNSVIVQPKPFGGSSGFGSKLPDPERPPLPQFTVVFGTTLDHTRAARACGMRVISLVDNHLADAVIDEIDVYLDDIATPGSFWLNPPHPRDDEGNRVDIFSVIENLESLTATTDGANDANSLCEPRRNDAEEDDFDSILADIAPLS